MKPNYNPIADGNYILEHKDILTQLGSWDKMTEEEKQFFEPCTQCPPYEEYVESEVEIPYPCETCPDHKTECQVDNHMTTLRRKYFERRR